MEGAEAAASSPRPAEPLLEDTKEKRKTSDLCFKTGESGDYSSEEDYDYDDDPETMWKIYLRGKRIHGTNYTPKAKTTANKRVEVLETRPQTVSHETVEPKQTEKFKGSTFSPVKPAPMSEKLKESTFSPVEPATMTENKKPKMRTASDVISRILWDIELPAENFTVGYLDRFVGLTEKPFGLFSWEHLASVDYDVLAIPKHRIVYFKYRDMKVWDKNQRLDLVFGSTESETELGIHDYVKMLDDEWIEKTQRNESASEEDADSEDELEIRVQSSQPRAFPKQRPNYFVAMRVTDPNIVAKVAEIKNHIQCRDARYADFLMPDAALHITMAMLRLDGEAEVERAVEAVQGCRTALQDFFAEPIQVRLQGLATFNGYVLYVGVKASPKFYELHSALLEHFRSAGVPLAHEFDFVPHVTIVKLTRSRAKVLRNPCVDPYVYATYKDCDLGVQTCDNLNLCIIGEEKRWDGFYSCETELKFN